MDCSPAAVNATAPVAQPDRRTRDRRWPVVALITLILGLGPHVPSVPIDVLGLVPSAQALLPAVVAVAIILGTILVLVRAPKSGLVLLAGAVAAAAPQLLWSPGPSQASVSAQMTVMSLNVEVSGADTVELAERIREVQPDVVVLLEVDRVFIRALLDERPFEGIQGVSVIGAARGGVEGSVLLSPHRMHDEGTVPVAAEAGFEQPVATVEIPQLGSVRVAAAHPPPPIVGAGSWAGALDSLDTWQEAMTDRPLVLAGDFNASTAHPSFRSIAEGMRDTAVAAGPIPTPTWPMGSLVPPFTAIDHVMIRDLEPAHWQRFVVPGTDHAGVVARVALPAVG